MINKVSISQADYNELNSKDSRWTLEEYCYWVAKFKSGYPPEGYGIWNVQLLTETEEKISKDYRGREVILHNYKYYIIWKCRESCD